MTVPFFLRSSFVVFFLSATQLYGIYDGFGGPGRWSSFSPVHVNSHYPANNCEFYINGFIRTRLHYSGAPEDLFIYISVNEKSLVADQKGAVLQVGMMVNHGGNIYLAQKIEPAYYLLQYQIPYGFSLEQFAFFVDVRRSSGSVHRLWISNGGTNFQWPSVVENQPSFTEYQGRTEWIILQNDAKDASPLFNQRKACVH